jgi:hypothetical protein
LFLPLTFFGPVPTFHGRPGGVTPPSCGPCFLLSRESGGRGEGRSYSRDRCPTNAPLGAQTDIETVLSLGLSPIRRLPRSNGLTLKPGKRTAKVSNHGEETEIILISQFGFGLFLVVFSWSFFPNCFLAKPKMLRTFENCALFCTFFSLNPLLCSSSPKGVQGQGRGTGPLLVLSPGHGGKAFQEKFLLKRERKEG